MRGTRRRSRVQPESASDASRLKESWLQKKKKGRSSERPLGSRKWRNSCSANARVTCGGDHVQERRRTKIFPFFCFSSKLSSRTLGKQDQETLPFNQNGNPTTKFSSFILTQGEKRWTKHHCNFSVCPFFSRSHVHLSVLSRRTELENFRRYTHTHTSNRKNLSSSQLTHCANRTTARRSLFLFSLVHRETPTGKD